MVQASELRIGNWIEENGRKFRVDEIRHWHYSDASPIPLTPEILVRAGFSRNVSTGNYTISINGYAFGISEKGDVDIDYLQLEGVANIKYLHQLQNLYFALKGEELQIEF